MTRDVRRYDVVLVGGGITGLMVSHKLSRLGLRLLLLEKQPTLASGPSTRNEGWLHRGSYHAGSIRDRESAVQVARRCIYGHEQIRAFAPEAVEDADRTPLVLVRDADRVQELVSRWDEAGVWYRPRTRAAASASFPSADLSRAAAVFEVADVSLNTRMLYRKLLTSAQQGGTEVLTGARLERINGLEASVRTASGETLQVEAGLFVYSAGFGARDLFRDFFQLELPIRYWKSHLVVVPRLGAHGLFYVDAHEAAMMHHGGYSIVGLNEDALLCTEPDYNVIAEKADNLHRALERLVPGWKNGAPFTDVACTKVDFAPDASAARSLNIAIHEPVPGHICILPGKMTETPFLTDVLTARLYERLEDGLIAKRPCDVLHANLTLARRESSHAA
ncbi:FAD-binding oxidoreductase [Corallococcus sp. AB049A]|uniref:FAD-binding oxidoreductase n=1 Tax=Corallococcus interemptor TaxID=2316720 RepID=A0A3A8QZ67_9BACT|nr:MULTISPECIES: FAD-dependent oxidoreductase [Corallococcus]RKH53121.1 FAD-binding oxidoreductase [Corallococcus sp. AB050B]RKH73081.1 FAD-binding oxidoreductase [Corallococcus interemptor]RKI75393.1 FAD-binding oxidoreductase [Corallococcus sp. AB049A]